MSKPWKEPDGRISRRPYEEAHELAHSPRRIFPSRWTSRRRLGVRGPTFILGLDLRPAAKLLYLLLVSLSHGHKATSGYENAVLADLVGVSQRTLQGLFRELEEQRLIARMPPVPPEVASRYIFFDHPGLLRDHWDTSEDRRQDEDVTLPDLLEHFRRQRRTRQNRNPGSETE